MALFAIVAIAQQPVIVFEKTEHDFGQINESDGRVSVVFNFKNEGMSPLVLSNVRASCGCTTPTWTKEPIEPGQTGSITVTYNPNGRPGHFQKTVTITSNATEATTRIYIKGEVIPKQAQPVNKYPIQVGALSMKSKTLDLGVIKKGAVKGGELAYANHSGAELNVELATSAADAFLSNQISLPTIQNGQEGKFVFALDSKGCKQYGPVEVSVYVVLNGKKDISETFRLVIKANIEEDFSNLSLQERQMAPIMETAESVDLGTVAAGKAHKFAFPIKNIGVNPLEIRRAYCTDKNVEVKAPKSIKSGKKGAINLEINAKDMTAGAYSREIEIITNDPKQAKKHVTVTWKIE